MAKSVSRWWYAVAIALAVGGFFVRSPGARGQLLLLAWIWPVLIWSPMGCRERYEGTSQLIFSASSALRLQLPAQWCAGFIVTLLTGSGVLLSMVLTQDIAKLAAWVAAAMFIPSFALALGATTGTRKAFEILYVSLCYVGPLNGVVALDFMGVGSSPNASVWLVLALMCAGIAFVARWRGLNR